MKFEKQAKIYTCTAVSNGYGGFVKDVQLFDTVEACITPIHCDVQLSNNITYTLESCKLFTTSSLPKIIDHVTVDNIDYNVLSQSDFGKYKMLLLQKVG